MADHAAAQNIRDTVSARAIGIVGLDALGLSLARRLVACGLRIIGWDRNADARTAFGALGSLAETAANATDLGHECDVVLSTLPAAELFTAALGDGDRPGFAPEMAPGSLVVDMGVGMPSDAQRLAAILGRGGIGLVDAPALGTPSAAALGRLVIPAGGFVEFVDRLKPLLSLFGEPRVIGPHGRGHAMAALIVYRQYQEAEAARRAFSVGLACGLPRELLADVEAAVASTPAADDPRLAIALRLAAETTAPASPLRAVGE